MGKRWKYEPEDEPSNQVPRQFKDLYVSTGKGIENAGPFDNDGKQIYPEPESKYPPLNKNTWDH